MALYKVGAPIAGIPLPQPEGPRLMMAAAGTAVTVFMYEPTEAEVREFRFGTAQFAWVDAGPVAVMCVRFGALEWMDCPFSPWDSLDLGRPAAEPGSHLLVQLVLADGGTGVVRVLRAVTWPPGFTAAVTATVTRQLTEGRPPAAGAAAQLDALYQIPTRQLTRRAAATCVGGASRGGPRIIPT